MFGAALDYSVAMDSRRCRIRHEPPARLMDPDSAPEKETAMSDAPDRPPGEDDHPELPLDPDARPLHRIPHAVGLVLLGGMGGTALRYALGGLLPTPGGWPLATVSVNLVGAFVLGVLLEALARRGADVGGRLRLAAGTGFCGAFTTYSALAVDTNRLLAAGRPVDALGYVALTVAGGFVASVLGVWTAARRSGDVA